MKKSSNFILFILFQSVILSIISCDKDNIRNEPSHFIVFKTTNDGRDFFANNPAYKPDSVIEESSAGVRGNAHLKKINGVYRMEWNTNTAKMIMLDYQNGDVDTLIQEWTPVSNTPNRPLIDELTNWKVFFNGKLVKEYDFKNNTALKDELVRRNCNNCTEYGNNPILIEIKK